MHMNIRSGPAAALAALALVPAASADAARAVPKPHLVARADAACTAFHKRARRVPEPSVDFAHLRARDLPAIARYVDRLHPIMMRLDHRLHALGVPDRGAATWRRIVADFEGDIRLLSAQGAAADRGDVAGVKRAVKKSESPNGPGERGSKLAKRFGLKACG